MTKKPKSVWQSSIAWNVSIPPISTASYATLHNSWGTSWGKGAFSFSAFKTGKFDKYGVTPDRNIILALLETPGLVNKLTINPQKPYRLSILPPKAIIEDGTVDPKWNIRHSLGFVIADSERIVIYGIRKQQKPEVIQLADPVCLDKLRDIVNSIPVPDGW